jgi:hypothetical protein
MKYKLFTGQGSDIEKKINEWLTPSIIVDHICQSSLNALINEKQIPITLISVFYTEKHQTNEGRQVE